MLSYRFPLAGDRVIDGTSASDGIVDIRIKSLKVILYNLLFHLSENYLMLSNPNN